MLPSFNSALNLVKQTWYNKPGITTVFSSISFSNFKLKHIVLIQSQAEAFFINNHQWYLIWPSKSIFSSMPAIKWQFFSMLIFLTTIQSYWYDCIQAIIYCHSTDLSNTGPKLNKDRRVYRKASSIGLLDDRSLISEMFLFLKNKRIYCFKDSICTVFYIPILFTINTET